MIDRKLLDLKRYKDHERIEFLSEFDLRGLRQELKNANAAVELKKIIKLSMQDAVDLALQMTTKELQARVANIEYALEYKKLWDKATNDDIADLLDYFEGMLDINDLNLGG